jgi:hypothetical protein
VAVSRKKRLKQNLIKKEMKRKEKQLGVVVAV